MGPSNFCSNYSCIANLQFFLFASISILLVFFQGAHSASPSQSEVSGYPVQVQTRQQQQQQTTQKIICRFRGKEFSTGDVWYPSSTIVTGYCVSCICLNSGRQNCTKLECPSNCKNGNGNGDDQQHPCCKSCGDKSQQPTNLDSENSGDSSAQSQRSFQKSSSPFGPFGGSHAHAYPPQPQQQDSGEDMDDGDEDEVVNHGENSEFISCLHQGKIYKDGDSFTANMSGLPIASEDQCMQCKCQTGMVVCHMDACSDFKCGPSGSSSGSGSPSQIQGSNVDTCCQRCAARKSGESSSSKVRKPLSVSQGEILRTSVLRKPSPNQTTSNNGNNNNESPRRLPGYVESGPFDTESAVAFRDVNSIRALGNMAGSANIGNGNGNNGIKKQGSDDCISAGRFYMHGSVWHPIIGPFGAMECVVCKCHHGQIECSRLKCPPRRELPCSKPVKVEGHCCPICNSPPSVSSTNDRQPVTVNVEAGQVMCVPSKQDVTAFKCQGSGANGTEFIEFAFLRQRRTNPDTQVEQHLWALRDGEIDEFTTQYLSTGQFEGMRARQTFVLLGATNEKNIEKFTRREKKLEKRCFSKCSIRITSLERSLRLHRLITRSNCLAHERLVVTA